MTIRGAIDILKEYNYWRKNFSFDSEIKFHYSSSIINEAIDTIINYFSDISINDCKLIVSIADKLLEDKYHFDSEDDYYSEILNRFNNECKSSKKIKKGIQ